MTSAIQRRAFIAASTLTVPAIAVAGVSMGNRSAAGAMDFEDLMKQIGRNLKTMRGSMRSLDTVENRDEAAFYANQITILLAQSIEVADQVHVPEQSKAKYADAKSAFTKDLQLALSHSAAASITLTQALITDDQQGAKAAYSKLKMIRNDGHGEFQDDD